MPDKTKKRIEQLLSAFDSGAVQPEELIKAIDTVMEIVTSNAKQLADLIMQHKGEGDTSLKQLRDSLAQAEDNLRSLVDDARSLATTSTAEIRRSLLEEIARVERAIPVLPPETDLTDVFNAISDLQNTTGSLSELVIGENIRNALEALPEGEKLVIDAIQDLPQKLEEIQKMASEGRGGGATALIARYLYQISDVDVAGAANGDTLTYNSSTKRWVATTPAGGGDMTKAVYDTNNDGIVDKAAAINGIASAGNSKYYGTDGSGTGGFYSLPSGSGITRTISSISTNTTGAAAASTDYVYIATAGLVFTLPTAVGNTNRYTLKAATSGVSFATTSSQTVDGSLTGNLITNQSLDFISDGSNWRII